jgi:hypothetical protein
VRLARYIAVIVVAAALSADGSRAEQPDVVGDHAKITVKAGEHVVIGAHALWNMECQGSELPPIQLERRPARGFVCISRGLIKPSTSRSGVGMHCVGRPVAGLRVIYIAPVGAAGHETLSYAVDFARARISRDIEIQIEPSGRSAANRATVAPAQPQDEGPIVGCSESTS